MNFSLIHTCICVSDLEKSLGFYEKALGLKKARTIESDMMKLYFLEDPKGNFQLELMFNKNTESYNLGDNPTHIAFKADDIESAFQYHVGMGCKTQRFGDKGIYFIEDPDGYKIEIIP